MPHFACTFSLIFTASVASAQTIPPNVVPSAAPTVTTSLPSPPSGRSTVMGGEIQKLDMVRDQLSLKVAGGHTVKILFDERTQVYKDGKKIALLDLHPEDHASIETTLDGTAIFALRIHMLSDLPEGRIPAKVMSYDVSTGKLKVMVASSHEPLTFVAGNGTAIARVGQAPFAEQKSGLADLVPGSLIEVAFKSGKTGLGTATHIDVRAVPGAEFIFRGNLSFLDLRTGHLSIDTGADRPMDLVFDSAHFEAGRDLHEGTAVKATTRFDGNHYIVSSISAK